MLVTTIFLTFATLCFNLYSYFDKSNDWVLAAIIFNVLMFIVPVFTYTIKCPAGKHFLTLSGTLTLIVQGIASGVSGDQWVAAGLLSLCVASLGCHFIKNDSERESDLIVLCVQCLLIMIASIGLMTCSCMWASTFTGIYSFFKLFIIVVNVCYIPRVYGERASLMYIKPYMWLAVSLSVTTLALVSVAYGEHNILSPLILVGITVLLEHMKY
jgi:hypothetical protein